MGLHLISSMKIRYYRPPDMKLLRRTLPFMSKTEITLLMLIALVLIFAFWFISSNQLWVVVSFLETRLYPTIVAPQ